MYPDPFAFKPERFLLNGKLNPAVKAPDVAFGFGRRYARIYELPLPDAHVLSQTLPGKTHGSLVNLDHRRVYSGNLQYHESGR
jgi:hypothetical protein